VTTRWALGALPHTSVVKTLCTVTADVQVNPQAVSGGEHDMFVAGNDPAAKTAATDLLGQYGWRSISTWRHRRGPRHGDDAAHMADGTR
jgi:predicted dinucleotide-binding enzyme